MTQFRVPAREMLLDEPLCCPLHGALTFDGLAIDREKRVHLAVRTDPVGGCGMAHVDRSESRVWCPFTGQGPPRQWSMRWWSGVKPLLTPHRTAWVRLATSILR